jgi:predicted ATP-grasp superfamily ATP-dependent carboligase
MVGTRSTARALWAAIAGVVLGAALLAGANDPAPASAAHARAAAALSACVADGVALAVCSAGGLSSR